MCISCPRKVHARSIYRLQVTIDSATRETIKYMQVNGGGRHWTRIGGGGGRTICVRA